MKLEWKNYTLIGILIVFFFIHISILNSFKHIPSPIYGGDYYRDRGFIQSIVTGFQPWEDGYYLNELQYYSWLIFGILGYLVKLTGLPIDKVFLLASSLIPILSTIIYYFLGKQIFKDKNYALLTGLSALTFFNIFPSIKSSQYGLGIFIPASIYFYLKYEEKNRLKDGIILGILLGTTALVHGGRFLAIIGTITITIAIKYLLKLKEKKYLETTKEYIKKYYLIYIIAITISFIFFGPLFLRYGGEQPNDVTHYGDTKIELLGPSWLFSTISHYLFNTSHITKTIYGLSAILGIMFLYLNRDKNQYKITLLLFISNIILLQHHLITRPLLGEYFLPQKLYILQIFLLIFSIAGIKNIFLYIKNKIKIKYFIIGIILLLLLPLAKYNYNNYFNNRWVQYGLKMDPGTQSLYELGEYLKQTVHNNETILANDETSFMLSAVSGKKVMITRRTHASYFVDIDKRIAEATIIMYGHNLNLTKKLLKKYKVKYFYYDEMLTKNEMKTIPKYKLILDKQNITNEEKLGRPDPAVEWDKATIRDLVFIPPQKLSKEFKSIIKPIHNVTVNGQISGILFEVNYE